MAAVQISSSKGQKTSLAPLPSKGSHYLGGLVCNILGDKAYLYLKEGSLEVHIYSQKGEFVQLPSSQIQGGKEGKMPQDELIQLVQTVSGHFLFASYRSDGNLRIFSRDFQEIQKNQFLKPRISFPPDFFECVPRRKILQTLYKTLEKESVVALVKDPKLPLKRVGKTEVAQQYLKEHAREYKHVFWIQSFDPWYFERDLEDMARELKISLEEIPQFLASDTSYLIIFDEVTRPELVEKYLPKETKQGHILITSRESLWKQKCLNVGTLTKDEGIEFLLKHAQGEEQEAKEIAQTLRYVPSSLYRAVETIVVEDLTLSTYGRYCETRLEKHAQVAKEKGNLPPRNQNFTGREANLVALEESFSENKPVVLAANKGLGGVGKTQIALQYAYRTCPGYNLIWWVNASDIDLSYGTLAQRLGVYLTNEEKKEEHAIVKRVNNYLEGNPGWLLVFDNVEDAKSIRGFLPESGGHVLITTRSADWDHTQVEVFGVEVFDREESIEFILKETQLYDQEAQADKLAETLQDLPLAIAQAAAYIRETGITIEEYIEDFEKWHKALWKREEPTNNYEFTVNITWNISMEKIQEKEENVPYPIALPLMQLCSFLAPNDIPRDLFLLEWLKMEYKKKELDTKACIGDLNRTLKLLGAFSMIKVEEDRISIHSLVQMMCRDQLEFNSKKIFYSLGIDILLKISKKSRPYSEDNLLIVHADHIARHVIEFDLQEDRAIEFLSYVANAWYTRTIISKSIYWLRKNIDLHIKDKTKWNDLPELLTLVDGLCFQLLDFIEKKIPEVLCSLGSNAKETHPHIFYALQRQLSRAFHLSGKEEEAKRALYAAESYLDHISLETSAKLIHLSKKGALPSGLPAKYFTKQLDKTLFPMLAEEIEENGLQNMVPQCKQAVANFLAGEANAVDQLKTVLQTFRSQPGNKQYALFLIVQTLVELSAVIIEREDRMVQIEAAEAKIEKIKNQLGEKEHPIVPWLQASVQGVRLLAGETDLSGQPIENVIELTNEIEIELERLKKRGSCFDALYSSVITPMLNHFGKSSNLAKRPVGNPFEWMRERENAHDAMCRVTLDPSIAFNINYYRSLPDHLAIVCHQSLLQENMKAALPTLQFMLGVTKFFSGQQNGLVHCEDALEGIQAPVALMLQVPLALLRSIEQKKPADMACLGTLEENIKSQPGGTEGMLPALRLFKAISGEKIDVTQLEFLEEEMKSQPDDSQHFLFPIVQMSRRIFKRIEAMQENPGEIPPILQQLLWRGEAMMKGQLDKEQSHESLIAQAQQGWEQFKKGVEIRTTRTKENEADQMEEDRATQMKKDGVAQMKHAMGSMNERWADMEIPKVLAVLILHALLGWARFTSGEKEGVTQLETAINILKSHVGNNHSFMGFFQAMLRYAKWLVYCPSDQTVPSLPSSHLRFGIKDRLDALEVD